MTEIALLKKQAKKYLDTADEKDVSPTFTIGTERETDVTCTGPFISIFISDFFSVLFISTLLSLSIGIFVCIS